MGNTQGRHRRGYGYRGMAAFYDYGYEEEMYYRYSGRQEMPKIDRKKNLKKIFKILEKEYNAAPKEELETQDKETKDGVEKVIEELDRTGTEEVSKDNKKLLRKCPRVVLERAAVAISNIIINENRHTTHSFDYVILNYVKAIMYVEESDHEEDGSDVDTPKTAKFTIDNEQKLMRELLMGDRLCKPTYGEDPSPPVTAVIQTMINNGEGPQVVETLLKVSKGGRAPKQDGLMKGLAACCRSQDMDTKRAAYMAVKEMCRIPTHTFQFVRDVENYDEKTTGWGRGLRTAICKLYNGYANNPRNLAMHVTKYMQRHDWKHMDLFRLCHIKPKTDALGFIVRFVVKGMDEAEKQYLEDGYLGLGERAREEKDAENLKKVHKYLKGVEEAKRCEDATRTVELISEHDLVREQLNTKMLNEPSVWKAMLPKMPLFALIRNLSKITKLEIFEDPDHLKNTISQLTKMEALQKARIHPLKILLAHRAYEQGKTDKGDNTWTPKPEILDALDKAFHLSFATVEPTNQRILIGLDISGSMESPYAASPSSPTCREVASLLTLIFTKVEKTCDVVAFCDYLVELDWFRDEKLTLKDLNEKVSRLEMGATDCSRPMTWARKFKKKQYDAFIIITDSETNMHRIPPCDALDRYRVAMNLPTAKLLVVAMKNNIYSIARPGDIHMMDIGGFDPETPQLIHDFLDGGFE